MPGARAAGQGGGGPALSRPARLALAAVVAGLAVAPLALGALPSGPPVALASAALAGAGAWGVWRWPGLALAVAATGLALVAADLATRPLLSRTLVRAEDRYARLWRVDPAGVVHDPDVDVVWPMVGNLAAQGGAVVQPRRVRFQTDAAGFRNRPRRGPARVVLLGDSFGAGAGTSQEAIASERLTRDHGLPTVNLSVSGASPYDEAVTLAATLPGLDLAPDATLVWLLFAGNDYEGECRAALPGPPSSWNRLRARVATVRARSVIGGLWRRLAAEPPVPLEATLPSGEPVSFYRPDLAHAALSEAEALALPRAACLDGVFAAVRSLAQSAGLDVRVAVAPMKVEVYGRHAGLGDPPGGPGRALLAMAARHGFETVDLRPPFRDAADRLLPSGRLLYWRDDTHWSPAGHALAAALLAEALGADEAGAAVR